MPLKVKVQRIEVDLEGSRAEVHQAMVEFITEALKTYVIAATNQIPVLTGAAKATFTKLATAAGVELLIVPVAPENRIDFGDSVSKGSLFANQTTGEYGWTYSSDLEYIHIVDSRNQFLDAGASAITDLRPNLPEPKQQP